MGHLLISCSCKKEKQAICQKGQCNFRLELLVVHCFKMFYILCPQKLHSHFIISQGVGHRNDILRKKRVEVGETRILEMGYRKKIFRQINLQYDLFMKFLANSVISEPILFQFFLVDRYLKIKLDTDCK